MLSLGLTPFLSVCMYLFKLKTFSLRKVFVLTCCSCLGYNNTLLIWLQVCCHLVAFYAVVVAAIGYQKTFVFTISYLRKISCLENILVFSICERKYAGRIDGLQSS